MADIDKNPPVPLAKPSPVAGKVEIDEVTGLPKAPDADDRTLGEIIEEQPALSDYKGQYTYKRDGLTYALAIKDDPIRGRPYHAMNTRFFWEGTQVEFEAQFVKV